MPLCDECETEQPVLVEVKYETSTRLAPPMEETVVHWGGVIRLCPECRDRLDWDPSMLKDNWGFIDGVIHVPGR